MKRVICILLVSILFCCSCNNAPSERDKKLDEVRAEQHKYDILDAGYTAVNSLHGMLSYYDNASYQKAKSTAKVSAAVSVEYFPSVSWEGSAFLSEPIDLVYDGVYLTFCSDTKQTFLLVTKKTTQRDVTMQAYSVTYSVSSDEITQCTLLFDE